MNWVRELLGRIWVQHLIVLVVASALLLPNLSLGLYDPWETHYAEVSRRIWIHGDWITMRWHADSRLGRDVNARCQDNPEECYFFSKPILIYWLMGLTLGVAGVDEEEFNRRIEEDRDLVPVLMARNDAAARFPFVIIGILGVFGVYFYLRKIVGLRAGLLGAGVLLTTPHYYFLSRQIMTDIAFVVPMTISLLALLYWLTKPDEAKARHLYFSYALAGVATLAKGLLGFLLPSVILFSYLLLTEPATLLAPLFCWDRELLGALRDRKRLFELLRQRLHDFSELLFERLRLLRGLLVFLTVAAPWYVAVWAINGRRWYDEFIVKHHLRRVGAGVHGERGTFEYFIEQLGYGLWPWVAFVPLALGAAWLVGRRTGTPRPVVSLHTLLTLWAGIAFGLFTISTTKFHHYIFPAVPAFSMLIALSLEQLLQRGRLRAVDKGLLTLGGVLLIVITPILVQEPFRFINLFIYAYDRRWPEIESAAPFLIATVSLFALGFVLLYAGRRLLNAALIVLVTAALLGAAWGVHGLMVEMVDYTSQRSTWETYHRLRQPGDRLYQWSLRWRGEVWYSFDQVREIPQGSESRMRRALSQPGRAFIATLSFNALNSRIRRMFNSSVEAQNEHNIRYHMTLWEGPPEGSERRHIVERIPPRATEVNAELGDGIELVAYEIRPTRIRREHAARVTLYFRPQEQVEQDWTVFIHGDVENQARRHRMINDHAPADGLHPTIRWQPGEIIKDESDLIAARGQRTGEYTLFVGLFNDSGRAEVRSGPTDGNDRVRLGQIEVTR